jgi:hypothetical protein
MLGPRTGEWRAAVDPARSVLLLEQPEIGDEPAGGAGRVRLPVDEMQVLQVGNGSGIAAGRHRHDPFPPVGGDRHLGHAFGADYEAFGDHRHDHIRVAELGREPVPPPLPGPDALPVDECLVAVAFQEPAYFVRQPEVPVLIADENPSQTRLPSPVVSERRRSHASPTINS